jgi:A/G-specific adenine glycosylase
MLQQTRVEAVKPYYAAFIKALPNVTALAEVSEDVLLKLWQGLGYYSRAHNLQKAARIVQQEYDGELPNSYDLLLKLPGIGAYTAAAISSIAFGERQAVVDGNVIRVIARLCADGSDYSHKRESRV